MTRSFFAHAVCGLAAAATLACSIPAKAAMFSLDNAANYTTWTNGSNGGTGFGAWDLTNNSGSADDGYFLGDSTQGSGDINTNSQAFAIFAHGANVYADATRAFTTDPVTGTSAVTLGQTFTIQLAVAFRNGNKGINLSAGGNEFFNFNTGNDDYTYTNAGGTQTSLGLSYEQNSVFTLTYIQQTATTGLISIYRDSNATPKFSETVTEADFTSFTLYNSGTDDSSSQNNLYFNNMSVVPEPSTYVCMAMGLTGLIAFQRRKR